MSPSSRGIIAGLLLALAGAIGCLALNSSWLLPGTDETGVAYLTGTPMIVAGVPSILPWAEWDAEEPGTALTDGATGFPILMSAMMRLRPRAHVAALWTVALSAGLLLLALGWVGGGVAGIGGAAWSGVILASTSTTVLLALSVRPELLAMALVAGLLGLMTYQPRWHVAHGFVGALAWSVHPAGLGAAAAAAAWPTVRGTGRDRWMGWIASLVPVIGLLLMAPRFGGLGSLGLVRAEGATAVGTVVGLLGWFGAGLPGVLGVLVGLGVLCGAVGLVLFEAVSAPPTPEDTVHWSDPRAHDVLASAFRPAAALLAFLLTVTALAGFGATGDLGASWALATVPIAAWIGSAVARLSSREGPRVRLGVAGAVALWIGLSVLSTAAAVGRVAEEGHGFTARRWVESEVIRWVDNRSDGLGPIYSSHPEHLVVQSSRGSRRLPADRASLDRFADHYGRRPGPIVVTGGRPGAPTVEDYRSALPVDVAVETPDGTVLVPRR